MSYENPCCNVMQMLRCFPFVCFIVMRVCVAAGNSSVITGNDRWWNKITNRKFHIISGCKSLTGWNPTAVGQLLLLQHSTASRVSGIFRCFFEKLLNFEVICGNWVTFPVSIATRTRLGGTALPLTYAAPTLYQTAESTNRNVTLRDIGCSSRGFWSCFRCLFTLFNLHLLGVHYF
jgi:hypothetical protein